MYINNNNEKIELNRKKIKNLISFLDKLNYCYFIFILECLELDF